MSKVDAQRAMREAKYARTRASGPTRREAAAQADPPKAPAPGRSRTTAEAVPEAAPAEVAPTAATTQVEGCGHKSMNGRTCTRPAGHAEKSHRYS
jgi:hypothetical protein